MYESRTSDATSPATRPADAARLIELEREKEALAERLQDAEASLERVRRAYSHALEHLPAPPPTALRGSAERAEVDATQLAFDAMFEQVQALSKTLDAAALADGDEGEDDADDKTKRKRRAPPTGRRDLADTDLPVIRVELTDPELEGKAECIGFEESSRLGYERGGARRIVVARAVYKVTEPEAPPAADAPEASAPTSETPPRFVTAPLPKELFRRALLAPSMIAHGLVSKYLLGVPFYRLEQSFALQGFTLDRGTMSRYAEDVGATLGAIVEAARDEAMRTAFCLSTDATGVRIQPGPLQERQCGPCRKGHFFVVLADRDHVFSEYQERHTSAAVCSMFKGYSGYLQADAHAVYDALFAGRPPVGRGSRRSPSCLARGATRRPRSARPPRARAAPRARDRPPAAHVGRRDGDRLTTGSPCVRASWRWRLATSRTRARAAVTVQRGWGRWRRTSASHLLASCVNNRPRRP